MLMMISNLERHGNYYREATLDFVVREKDKLYKAYSAAEHFHIQVGLMLAFIGVRRVYFVFNPKKRFV